jgi:cytochrome c5
MKFLLTAFFALVMAVGSAFAGSGAEPPRAVRNASSASVEANPQWLAEGEKRYRTNCGRCHQPPHKFPPRVMAMAVRHMRVRGMLTQSDMQYVLYYMTH